MSEDERLRFFIKCVLLAEWKGSALEAYAHNTGCLFANICGISVMDPNLLFKGNVAASLMEPEAEDTKMAIALNLCIKALEPNVSEPVTPFFATFVPPVAGNIQVFVWSKPTLFTSQPA